MTGLTESQKYLAEDKALLGKHLDLPPSRISDQEALAFWYNGSSETVAKQIRNQQILSAADDLCRPGEHEDVRARKALAGLCRVEPDDVPPESVKNLVQDYRKAVAAGGNSFEAAVQAVVTAEQDRRSASRSSNGSRSSQPGSPKEISRPKLERRDRDRMVGLA